MVSVRGRARRAGGSGARSGPSARASRLCLYGRRVAMPASVVPPPVRAPARPGEPVGAGPRRAPACTGAGLDAVAAEFVDQSCPRLWGRRPPRGLPRQTARVVSSPVGAPVRALTRDSLCPRASLCLCRALSGSCQVILCFCHRCCCHRPHGRTPTTARRARGGELALASSRARAPARASGWCIEPDGDAPERRPVASGCRRHCVPVAAAPAAALRSRWWRSGCGHFPGG